MTSNLSPSAPPPSAPLSTSPAQPQPQPHAPPRRILSIQSHVTSGYVGNKAAVFPLQLLGYDVDVLNSCTLSNHTGYARGARGARLSGADLADLLAGLRDNGLLRRLTHVLTGYIGTASFLHAVADAVAALRADRPALVFACDPVLGDNGKLYVAPELVPVYVDRVLGLASVLTPNAFELAVLASQSALSAAAGGGGGGGEKPAVDPKNANNSNDSSTSSSSSSEKPSQDANDEFVLPAPFTSEQQVLAACDLLHDRHGVPLIFVTGVTLSPDPDVLSVLVSARPRHGAHGRCRRVAVDVRRIGATFTGSGDLLSALLLAWNDRLPDDPVAACSRAVASVSAVLARTAAAPQADGLAPRPELRLVQSQSELLNPPLHLVTVRELDAAAHNGFDVGKQR